MVRNRIVLGVTTLCFSLLALARDPAAPVHSSSTVFVSDQDNGKTIDLTKGGTLVVQLESNPSTGYSWAVNGDPSPLKLVSSEYKQPDQSGRIGAQGIQEFHLEATAPGTSILKLVYRRPWEKNVAPAKMFALNVNVR